MKVCSFRIGERTSYGLVRGDRVVDLGRLSGMPATLRMALASAAFEAAAQTAVASTGEYALNEVTLLTPVTDPEKIICIGLNYRQHAAEGGFKIPEHPQLFARFSNTLVPPGEALLRPRISTDFDFEGELALVIGRGGRHVPREHALEHVFGYTCFNDGSVRDIQFKHSLVAGKNFPRTGALGPWLVTTDEIPDPARLVLTTRVNGAQVQHKGVDDLIFDVPTIVSYVSSWTELRPGDVISTGTPEGVGFARKPPLWLKPGDTVEVEISGIGVLRNGVEAEV